jgi:hypothetical protein
MAKTLTTFYAPTPNPARENEGEPAKVARGKGPRELPCLFLRHDAMRAEAGQWQPGGFEGVDATAPEERQWRRTQPARSQVQERFPQRGHRVQERVRVAPQCEQDGFGFTTIAQSFSCDIVYFPSPTASRASLGSK